MERWYVVHTAPNGEARATAHLRRQGFETFMPRFVKMRRHARRSEKVLAPLFPRYLFIQMNLSVDRWRAVNGTVGVSHLICSGDEPVPVRAGIVEALIAQADGVDRVDPAALQLFCAGDRLRIVDGALADQVGAFERMTADQRIVLLMTVLGREVKVTLPLASVDAA